MIKFVQTAKFKTIQFQFYFVDMMEKEAFAYRFLLARLLKSYTDKYKTKREFQRYRSYMFNIEISESFFIMNERAVLKMTFTMPDYRLVGQPEYLDEVIDLIKQCLFERKPFDQVAFDSVKRLAYELVSTLKERKSDYAYTQYRKLIYRGSDLSHPLTGSASEILAVESEGLYDYYLRYFLKSASFLVVSGCLIRDDITKIRRSFKPYMIGKMPAYKQCLLSNKGSELQTEYVQTSAAYVYVAYTLPVDLHDKLYYPALVTNAIIGGYVNSRLFRIFRESMGLAYSVYSDFTNDTGILTVFANVDNYNYLSSYEALIAIIDELKSNGITQAELRDAKNYLIESARASYDLQSRQPYDDFIYAIDGIYTHFGPTESRLKNVKMADIKQCLSLLKLADVYIMHGGGDFDESL